MDTSQQFLDAGEDGASDSGDRSSAWNLDALVAQLRLSREVTHNIRHQGRIRRTPSRETLSDILDGLSAALFPSHYGQAAVGIENIDYFVGNTLNNALQLLAEQVGRSLAFGQEQERPEAEIQRQARLITRDFAARLPGIRGLLVSDLRAAFQGDPAATNFPEILLGYPGMTAIVHYRLANALHGLGARLLARLISDIAHSRTGIDIHPAAQIGPSFFIDHGTGVVIGETTIIGERVRLYQAVTLGAKNFPTDDKGALIKGAPRHPVIEDDVVIYAGATILGRVTIGKGSTIGGNVWLTRSVPLGSQITQAQTRSSGPVE
jgi:serine O-acetyltransferase